VVNGIFFKFALDQAGLCVAFSVPSLPADHGSAATAATIWP
jgi:hypothetical protein